MQNSCSFVSLQSCYTICKDVMARNTQPMLTMNSLTSILMLVHTNSEAANDLLDATTSSHKLLVLTMTNTSCVRS